VLPSDNVFDERITMRHSGDFGGAPELMQFEWYYHPDTGGEVATDLPVVDGSGNIIDPRGWFIYSTEDAGQGFNDITIGEGPRNGLLTMSDNWFICRYRGYNIDGPPTGATGLASRAAVARNSRKAGSSASSTASIRSSNARTASTPPRPRPSSTCSRKPAGVTKARSPSIPIRTT
jgi:hypothetical protein